MPGEYVFSSFGELRPQDGAPTLDLGASWPGWSIARDAKANPSAPGFEHVTGVVLDGYGGLHPFWERGKAQPPGVSPSPPYWPNWDIARRIALTGFNRGYLLDGYGALHPFGGASAPSPAPTYTPGQDIAKYVVTIGEGKGYTLDAYGGIHPFGGAPVISPQDGAYWKGWDIARAIAVNPPTTDFPHVTGYLLDGFGGLHSLAEVGKPYPPARKAGWWPGWDIARDITLSGFATGYQVDGKGGLHPLAA
jgi:hypothetical protein